MPRSEAHGREFYVENGPVRITAHRDGSHSSPSSMVATKDQLDFLRNEAADLQRENRRMVMEVKKLRCEAEMCRCMMKAMHEPRYQSDASDQGGRPPTPPGADDKMGQILAVLVDMKAKNEVEMSYLRSELIELKQSIIDINERQIKEPTFEYHWSGDATGGDQQNDGTKAISTSSTRKVMFHRDTARISICFVLGAALMACNLAEWVNHHAQPKKRREGSNIKEQGVEDNQPFLDRCEKGASICPPADRFRGAGSGSGSKLFQPSVESTATSGSCPTTDEESSSPASSEPKKSPFAETVSIVPSSPPAVPPEASDKVWRSMDVAVQYARKWAAPEDDCEEVPDSPVGSIVFPTFRKARNDLEDASHSPSPHPRATRLHSPIVPFEGSKLAHRRGPSIYRASSEPRPDGAALPAGRRSRTATTAAAAVRRSPRLSDEGKMRYPIQAVVSWEEDRAARRHRDGRDGGSVSFRPLEGREASIGSDFCAPTDEEFFRVTTVDKIERPPIAKRWSSSMIASYCSSASGKSEASSAAVWCGMDFAALSASKWAACDAEETGKRSKSPVGSIISLTCKASRDAFSSPGAAVLDNDGKLSRLKEIPNQPVMPNKVPPPPNLHPRKIRPGNSKPTTQNCAESSISRRSVVSPLGEPKASRECGAGEMGRAAAPRSDGLPLPPVSLAVAVAAGYSHSLVLEEEGTVAAFGSDRYGQATVPPRCLDPCRPVRAVAAGADHSVALLWSGEVVAWGKNNSGQTRAPRCVRASAERSGSGMRGRWDPEEEESSPAVDVSAGYDHSLALLEDGTVLGWGYNGHGQASVPDHVRHVMAIACGCDHNVVLLRDGSVRAWGKNNYGQCSVPPTLSDAIGVAAGDWHSLALTSGGRVVAWGRNNYGQASVPPILGRVSSVSAGPYRSFALLANGNVVAWGEGLRTSPTLATRARAISAGAGHYLVLREDGSVGMGGDNHFGQTGVLGGFRLE